MTQSFCTLRSVTGRQDDVSLTRATVAHCHTRAPASVLFWPRESGCCHCARVARPRHGTHGHLTHPQVSHGTPLPILRGSQGVLAAPSSQKRYQAMIHRGATTDGRADDTRVSSWRFPRAGRGEGVRGAPPPPRSIAPQRDPWNFPSLDLPDVFACMILKDSRSPKAALPRCPKTGIPFSANRCTHLRLNDYTSCISKGRGKSGKLRRRRPPFATGTT